MTIAAACWRSWPRIVLAVPALVAIPMVLSSGWGAFKKTGVSYATQGRYLFAGVVGLTALASLGVARLLRRPSWWQPTATIGLGLALQAGGLWLALGRYYAGDGPLQRLRAMVAFAPVPGWLTAGVFVATGTIAAATLLAAAATAGTEAAEARLRTP